MYFADSADLEAHLNDDWSVFLHNLKLRQEMLHELLQYNHRVIRQRLQEDQLFTNDQILHHHARIAAATQTNAQIDVEEKQLIEKYESTVVSWQGVGKLMHRVGARVLETFQNSLEICKPLDEELVEKHARVKQTLIKMINHLQRIDLEGIAKLVIGFARTNLVAEIDRLKKIVQALQSGQLVRLREVYDYRARRASVQLMQKQKISAQKNKNSSVGREDRSPIREQIKKQQKVRKNKQKVATKLVHGLYSMLDLSRQQLMDDICGIQHGKATRLYNQIFSRNRFNHMQILAFEAKKDQFLEKLRLFKQMMERQSNRIAINLNQKILNKAKQKEAQEVSVQTASAASAHPQSQLQIEDVQDEPASQRKISNNRYRIQSPKHKRELKQFLNNFSCAMQATHSNFNHLKFDTTNQEIYPRSNRNRLPQINQTHQQNQNMRDYNRTTSLDQRVELNRTKIIRKHEEADNAQSGSKEMGKEERYFAQRAKFAIKKVQIGQDSRRLSKQAKKIQNFEPNPMEYTFYVRKNSKKKVDSKLKELL